MRVYLSAGLQESGRGGSLRLRSACSFLPSFLSHSRDTVITAPLKPTPGDEVKSLRRAHTGTVLSSDFLGLCHKNTKRTRPYSSDVQRWSYAAILKTSATEKRAALEAQSTIPVSDEEKRVNPYQ